MWFPQGSILVLLLFLLYIIDLVNVSGLVNVIMVIMFADDMNLFCCNTNLDNLVEKLTLGIEEVLKQSFGE